MLIAATKLVDIAARSLFVLLALYALPVRSTGLFGLALTLIGFFAFLSGFERYADLQRRMVDTTDGQADRLIISTLIFYSVNYALWLPVLPAPSSSARRSRFAPGGSWAHRRSGSDATCRASY